MFRNGPGVAAVLEIVRKHKGVVKICRTIGKGFHIQDPFSG
jgi:hypothetical protein